MAISREIYPKYHEKEKRNLDLPANFGWKFNDPD
jgi:hypothetical protein